ncbi:MAG: hypothetical protein FJ255_12530 [Phycisphaerae bacterium]|nr:hypothetical protein [Phycisphaerae bacterium]
MDTVDIPRDPPRLSLVPLPVDTPDDPRLDELREAVANAVAAAMALELPSFWCPTPDDVRRAPAATVERWAKQIATFIELDPEG